MSPFLPPEFNYDARQDSSHLHLRTNPETLRNLLTTPFTDPRPTR